MQIAEAYKEGKDLYAKKAKQKLPRNRLTKPTKTQKAEASKAKKRTACKKQSRNAEESMILKEHKL